MDNNYNYPVVLHHNKQRNFTEFKATNCNTNFASLFHCHISSLSHLNAHFADLSHSNSINTNAAISIMRSPRFRTTFDQSQLDQLERLFEQSHYPDACARDQVADELGLTETKVQIWFQNRRAKFRRTEKLAKATSNTSLVVKSITNRYAYSLYVYIYFH